MSEVQKVGNFDSIFTFPEMHEGVESWKAFEHLHDLRKNSEYAQDFANRCHEASRSLFDRFRGMEGLSTCGSDIDGLQSDLNGLFECVFKMGVHLSFVRELRKAEIEELEALVPSDLDRLVMNVELCPWDIRDLVEELEALGSEATAEKARLIDAIARTAQKLQESFVKLQALEASEAESA